MDGLCITLIPDLDAGATGSITGGDRRVALVGYERCLLLINYENRQCGLIATAWRLDPLVLRWARWSAGIRRASLALPRHHIEE